MRKQQQDYLSIGKVSKLKNVTIKALRYYDEIGILKPIYVNPDTNYRYYSANQLDVLDAIHICLTLGMPLKDLRHYLMTTPEVTNGNVSIAESGTIKNINVTNIDYQRLLNDCKTMADSKIRDIYNTLDALKAISQKITSKQYDMMKELDTRYLLVTECGEQEILNTKLLQLFMLSQQLGINAHYPSGIILKEKKRYAFLLLDSPKTDAEINAYQHPQILCLPKGTYSYHYSKEFISTENIQNLFSIPYHSYLELNLMDETLNQAGFQYEIQGLL